jgi:hypothetical protein
MGWTLFYMVVILKIPVAIAGWIVWWAVKQVPEPEGEEAGEDRGPRRRLPPLPRSPQRGPAGGAGCARAPCKQRRSGSLKRPAPIYARRGSET